MSDDETPTPDALSAARTDLAAALTAVLPDPVKDHPPAKLAPGGYVVPGDPWLERGDTTGSFKCRLEAVLLYRAVNNETVTQTLNGEVVEVVIAVENAASGWKVQAVSAPFAVTQDGDAQKYLAVQITATKTIHL